MTTTTNAPLTNGTATAQNSDTSNRARPAGVVLPCPLCGCSEGSITLDLSDPAEFHCSECEDAIHRDDIENMLAKWERVLRWIDTMPSFADLEATEAE